MGQWSDWGSCTRRNKTCGYKWGLETRTRHIVKKPPKDTIPCPTIAESRRCKMAMRHCRRGEALTLCDCLSMCGSAHGFNTSSYLRYKSYIPTENHQYNLISKPSPPEEEMCPFVYISPDYCYVAFYLNDKSFARPHPCDLGFQC